MAEPTIESADGEPRPAGTVVNDPAEIKALQEWVETTKLAMRGLDQMVGDYRTLFSVAWMRAAIEEALRWPVPPFSARPVVTMLKRWAAENGPTRPQDGPGGSGRPKGPTLVEQRQATRQALRETDAPLIEDMGGQLRVRAADVAGWLGEFFHRYRVRMDPPTWPTDPEERRIFYLAWLKDFVDMNVSEDEAEAALIHLVGTEDCPTWANEHLPAMKRAIRYVRERRRQAEADRERETRRKREEDALDAAGDCWSAMSPEQHRPWLERAYRERPELRSNPPTPMARVFAKSEFIRCKGSLDVPPEPVQPRPVASVGIHRPGHVVEDEK